MLQVVIPENHRDTTSLSSWFIPGQPFPVLQALIFALQIVRGMHYAAIRIPDFVHGNLKPENILVSGGRLSQMDVNRFRVTDFGLAAVLRAADVNKPALSEIDESAVAKTQSIHGVVGTPLYLSPEQWRGKVAVWPRTSMPSGVFCTRCLSGVIR